MLDSPEQHEDTVVLSSTAVYEPQDRRGAPGEMLHLLLIQALLNSCLAKADTSDNELLYLVGKRENIMLETSHTAQT